MTPSEIFTAIDNWFDANWTETPIAKPNKPFDPSTDSNARGEFLRWSYQLNDPDFSEELERGANGVGVRSGVLLVQIFTRLNIGLERPSSLAATAENLMFKANMNGVACVDAGVGAQGPDGRGKYQVNVKGKIFTQIGD